MVDLSKAFSEQLAQPTYGFLPAGYLQHLLLPLGQRLRLALDRSPNAPLVVAISGWPGAGKTTLAELLACAFNRSSLLTAHFSLDDLYFSSARREALAALWHPLFRFRGVPGTHDVQQGIKLISALRRAENTSVARLPRFDKWTDEPMPLDDCPLFLGQPRMIVVDGWFWGIKPVPASELQEPINELEVESDPDGRFRSAVNELLGREYPELFAQADYWIQLNLPDWESSVRFRFQQERALLAKQQPPRLLDEDRASHLLRFTQLMERVATRCSVSRLADCRVAISPDHDIASVSF